MYLSANFLNCFFKSIGQGRVKEGIGKGGGGGELTLCLRRDILWSMGIAMPELKTKNLGSVSAYNLKPVSTTSTSTGAND